MRKLLSILLLALLGLPVAAPLFALTAAADAGVPACCRRAGKHHCTMSATDRAGLLDQAPSLRAPAEKCPFCPQSLLSLHADEYTSSTSQAARAVLASHAEATAQAESQWRTARERSRGKRGPPAA